MAKDKETIPEAGTKAERKFYAAQRCINKIDDLFEYSYLHRTPKVLQGAIRQYLKEYTADLVRLEEEYGSATHVYLEKRGRDSE